MGYRIGMTNFHKGWGGQALQVLQLAQSLGERGHAVTVFSPPGSTLTERAQGAGIKTVTACQFPRGFRPLCLHADITAFRREICARNLDLIHCHGSQDTWVAVAARRMGGRFALLRTKHNSYPVRGHCFNRWLYSHWLDHTITVSDAIGEDIRNATGCPPERISTIHAGLPDNFGAEVTPEDRTAVREELGIPVDAPLAGIVGRLEVIKGHETLIRAFPRVRESHPDARLVIVGTGGDYDRLKGIVTELGLDESVCFTLFRPDVARVMSALDCLVMASSIEPWGLVVMEGMAVGVPVVATDSGGPGEILEHGACGTLVPPETEGALARGIIETLAARGRDTQRAQIERAKTRVREQYLMSAIAEQTLAVYARALETACNR